MASPKVPCGCYFLRVFHQSSFFFLTITFRRLHLVRDTSKEKPVELEMCWLCEESGFKHALVPKALVAAADAAGKAALEGSTRESSAATEEKSMEVVE